MSVDKNIIKKLLKAFMAFPSKEEAEIIRREIPDACITITSRQKKHGGKKYYVEESTRCMRLLRACRSGANSTERL